MNKFIFLFIAMHSMFVVFPQVQPQDLEEVTLEMLKEQKSPLDSSAAAEVLYEKGEVKLSITDGWEYEYQVVRRIKIYSEDGYGEADVQIPYFVGVKNSDRESVSKIDGFVYFEKDGEVERDKIRNRDIFDLDLSDKWEAKKFTLPKIQNGVIIEYSYTVQSPHIQNLPKWVFQDEIPTRYSEYSTRIPVEYMNYNVRTQGYLGFESDRNINTGQLFVASYGSVRTQIEETVSIAKNIPRIEKEPYVNNINNYLPSISYELSSFKTDKYAAQEMVSRSWDDVVKTMTETDTYSKELSRDKYFEDDLNKIIDGLNVPEDKMYSIFDFIKKKMTWDEKERTFTSDQLNKVYDDGIGNSADINIMLTAMLRAAGLDANPILSSTISNGIPLFPTVSGFNYVFTHVDINGTDYLLDATEKFSSPNILPTRLLNWSGTIISQGGFKTISLIPTSLSNKKYQVQAQLEETGNIFGKCRIISSEHFALRSRKSLFKKSLDEVEMSYEKSFSPAKVEEVSNLNIEDDTKPFVENFSFNANDEFVEKIGDKLYLSPMLFLKMDENPFKKESRIFPVDFTHPRKLEYFIVIKIPEGYKVEYMPKQEVLLLGGDKSKLTYLVNGMNNTISVNVKHEINETLFLPQNYKDLRDFYISLMNKENEKIVLVKS